MEFVGQDGEFCDPQLGCSSRLVGEDLSQEHAQQFSQELRLASNFSGPLNFSVGANYLHYQTVEDYYVFINAISLLTGIIQFSLGDAFMIALRARPVRSGACKYVQSATGRSATVLLFTGFGCAWIDPNPIDHLDGQGHNYFRSQNPYSLNSWAGFGEVYYQVAPDVKLTGGLRWTDDMKHFTEIPSWTAMAGKGYPIEGIVDPCKASRSAMEGMDGPIRRQLDAEARLHRSDAGLRLLFARLQRWWRQSARRYTVAGLFRHRRIIAKQRHASADLQAGIRGCV